MAYRLGDPIHSAVRCPKADCRRILVNGQRCTCTWRAPIDPDDPLIGQAVIAIGEDGCVIASGIVTATDRTGDNLELTVTQHPA